MERGCRGQDLTEILQMNGGWKHCSKYKRTLQIVHDEIDKIDFHLKNMLHLDLRMAPTFGAFRCIDHHHQNVFHTQSNHISENVSEYIFSDVNQVCTYSMLF